MKILIFNPLYIFFDETSIEAGALGGSETWAVQIADAFQKLGNQVYNVCWCGGSHVAKSGVYYINRDDIDKILSIRFDLAICVRLVRLFYRLMSAYHFVDRYFLMLEDTSCPDMTPEILNDTRLDKVITLTNWHASLIMKTYGLGQDRIRIIPNGVDVSLFDSVCSCTKPQYDHSVFWSSRAERGLKILTEDIQPLVRRKIGDFSVRAAVYSDDPNFRYDQLDVEVVESLSKKQLYSEMSQHCVWFYPSVFDETFCITAIENMVCCNDIVMYPSYGTTEYSGLIDALDKPFNDNSIYKEACNAAAGKIIWHIQHYNDKVNADMRVKAYDYVMTNFQWENIAWKFITLALAN